MSEKAFPQKYISDRDVSCLFYQRYNKDSTKTIKQYFQSCEYIKPDYIQSYLPFNLFIEIAEKLEINELKSLVYGHGPLLNILISIIRNKQRGYENNAAVAKEFLDDFAFNIADHEAKTLHLSLLKSNSEQIDRSMLKSDITKKKDNKKTPYMKALNDGVIPEIINKDPNFMVGQALTGLINLLKIFHTSSPRIFLEASNHKFFHSIELQADALKVTTIKI